jgi:hypothetical protein
MQKTNSVDQPNGQRTAVTSRLSRRQLLSGSLAVGAVLAAGDVSLPGSQNASSPSAAPSAGKFDVKLLEEKVVIKDWWYANCAMFCRDGTIILPMIGTLAKERKGEGKESFFMSSVLCSPDAGRTWREQETLEVQWTNKEGVVLPSNKPLCIGQWRQMSDGSVMSIGGNILNALVRKEQAYKPWVSTVRRAKSPAELLKGNYVDDFAKIEIPNLATLQGDSPNPTTGNAGKVVELDNGDLILPFEGRFNIDLIRVPYHEWEAYQFRTWLCRSTDGGRSWHYLSTVASPDRYPLPAISEQYGEPDVIKVEGAKLLAVMRTGGNPTGNGSTERYTDIVASTSPDNGVTWTAPRKIYKFGVYPRLLKMSNGIIVCSSGRPGVFLLFSRDGGATWSEPHIVSDYHVKWGECPSGYTSIGEVEPGILCLFYDDAYKNDQGKISNLVKMRKYQIA